MTPAVIAIGLAATVGLVAAVLRGDGAAKAIGAPGAMPSIDTTVTTGGPPQEPGNPTARTHAVMAAGPGGILMAGGQGPGGIHTDTWALAGTLDGGWVPRSGSTLLPPRSAATLVFAESIGAFLLFGGTSNPASAGCPPACGTQIPTDELWRYDPTEDVWGRISTFGPEARLGHAAAYDPQAGRLVVFGGVGSTGVPGVRAGRLLGDTWLYDPVAETWELVESTISPEPRVFHRMVHHAGTGLVYLWGGRTSDRGGDQAVWAFDSATGQWSVLPAEEDDPPARWLHALVVGSDGRLVIIGGEWFQSRQLSAGTTTVLGGTDEVLAWDPATAAWGRLTDFPVVISRHAAAATGEGRIVVFHGDHTTLYDDLAGRWVDVSPDTATTDH